MQTKIINAHPLDDPTVVKALRNAGYTVDEDAKTIILPERVEKELVETLDRLDIRDEQGK